MLRRRAYNQILAWKKSRTSQGLLVDGARQVGKTTIVREFARNNYDDLAEVNFYENKAAVATVEAATDSRDLLLRISALSKKELTPGKTLVFLDEIQECPDLLTWVKFLKSDSGSDFDFVLSGSLLGLDSFPARSLPVGFLNVITMYPLTFEEFCWAAGVSDALLAEAKDCILSLNPVPEYLDRLLVNTFYNYLLIGGFPDAVQVFANTADLNRVRVVHEGIHALYLYDIAKYVEDKVEARQVRMVYEAIPGQLNSQNKRFKYTRLGKNLRFANLETAFDWLGHAGVALAATKISEPTFPLGLSEDASSLKLYANDVGLLTSRLMPGVDLEILNRKSSINFGSLFENAAAQEFFAQGFNLHYFNTTGVGEVDFVLQTERGAIALCEIKSGKNYRRHGALNNLLRVENYRLDKNYVFCDGGMERKEAVTYLPIYALGLLGDLLNRD